MAAEKNLIHVATHLVERYRKLLYLPTKDVYDDSGSLKERGLLPVEKALLAKKDETAAFLMSKMKPDW